MPEIIPAIIAHSQEELEQKIKLIEPYVEKVQLDVMDGKFVSDTTIGLEELDKINTKLKIQVHLMVQQPENIIFFWTASPKVGEIIFHIEATDKTEEIVTIIKSSGKKAGIAINPDTSTNELDSLASKADFIQFMTVHPGKYGGDFVESVVDTIRSFHEQYPSVKIIVDGGINPTTVRKIISVGASGLVVGSYILSEGRNIGETIEELKTQVASSK